jgi:hypothetical protein
MPAGKKVVSDDTFLSARHGISATDKSPISGNLRYGSIFATAQRTLDPIAGRTFRS